MNKRFVHVLIFASPLILIVLALFSTFDNRLHLVFCDVGQGDGILIYRKSVQIVVDAGPGNAYLKCLSDHVPFWDRSIELVILTNPDRDHYGGMVEVFRRYQVEAFVSPGIDRDDASFEVLEAEAANEKAVISFLAVGKDIKVGNIFLQTLWPTQEWLAQETNSHLAIQPASPAQRGEPSNNSHVLGELTPREPDSINQTSVVFKLSYGSFDALLTGDVAPPATDDSGLIGQIRLMGPISVLKVPHHGSKNGLTQGMLEASKPELAVISVGEKNRYGHPHEEVIRLLGDRGIRTLRTDVDGEIEVVTDGKSWSTK